MPFSLDHIVPWGRSFDEYVGMFSLTEDDLSLRILGCGDGPAAFNSAMYKKGKQAISVDPIYQFSAEQIKERIDAIYPEMLEKARANQDDFVWDIIPSVEALGAIRMEAMNEFLSDFERGKQEGRYLRHSLPDLPFEDAEFDLALSSHFLFLYSEQLSEDFHRQAIREMRRVAREVRIFPLLAMGNQPSPHVERIIEELQISGCHFEIQSVQYEFQRGGNKMLRILSEGKP